MLCPGKIWNISEALNSMGEGGLPLRGPDGGHSQGLGETWARRWGIKLGPGVPPHQASKQCDQV